MLGRNIYAFFFERADLFCQMFYVNDHSGTHNVDGFISEYSGGEEVKDKLTSFVHDGMSGVIASLIARDDVVSCAEQIDHSAFSFVSPVGTDNCC